MTKKCNCPLCEPELVGGCLEPPFCKPCDVKLLSKCNRCGASFDSKLSKCSECEQLKRS